jgi:dodecin
MRRRQSRHPRTRHCGPATSKVKGASLFGGTGPGKDHCWPLRPRDGPGVATIDGGIMTNRTYRVTEIVGTSPDGVEHAINNALQRAGQTLRHLDWFEVTQIRGQITDDHVAHYQVGLKVGFRLEDT